MESERPDWDETYIEMARVLAQRATCRHKVATIVTVENRVVLAGYNGAPSGIPHCTDEGVGCQFYWRVDQEGPEERYEDIGSYRFDYWAFYVKPVEHCKRSIHAEQNVIGMAAKLGIALAGSTWYMWPYLPCESCQLLLLVVGAKSVVCKIDGSHSGYRECSILESAGVEVRTVS